MFVWLWVCVGGGVWGGGEGVKGKGKTGIRGENSEAGRERERDTITDGERAKDKIIQVK